MRSRGKKIFRRFQDDAHSERTSSAGSEISGTQEQRQLKRQAGPAARRPLTRSAIKPRLLFPSDEQLAERERGPDDVDEEAVTDIEMGDAHEHDHAQALAGAELELELQTPQKHLAHAHVHFAEKPATPPPTHGRATRSKKVSPVKDAVLTPDVAEAMDSSFDSATSALGGKMGKGKGRSPFDAWPRGKPGKRRAGEEVLEGEGVGKRTRGVGGEGSSG